MLARSFYFRSQLNLAIPVYTNGSELSPTVPSPIVATSLALSGFPASSTLSTTSCPPCAIGVDSNGLNQIAWFNESIELTLDTVSVYVTIYNGTNRTASVPSRSTIYGDLATIDVEKVEEAQSISSKYLETAVIQYMGGGSVMLARQTDGAIQSITSIPWPTPFIKISSLDYAYSTVSANDPYATCQFSSPGALHVYYEGVTSRPSGSHRNSTIQWTQQFSISP